MPGISGAATKVEMLDFALLRGGDPESDFGSGTTLALDGVTDSSALLDESTIL